MKNNKKNREAVLLLGANNQAMLVMARQMSKLGYAVDVADWQNLPVKYSRFIRKYYILSDLTLNADAFVKDLVEIIKGGQYLFMQAVNDAALEVCVKYNLRINPHVKLLAVPDEAAYNYSHNKYSLIQKCQELGIKVPKYVYIDSSGFSDEYIKDLKYPVIAKPIHSKLIKNNKLYQYNVKKIHTSEELTDFLREHVLNVPVMIQEVIGGFGAGYNVIAKDGIIKSAYQHQRLTEPIEGGASSYRKTVHINEYGLKLISEKLLKVINWSGPAMIEYKIENGVPYVMEINGRFWGSLSLGIKAGLNFPAMLIEHFIKNRGLHYIESGKIVFSRNIKLDFRFALSKTLYYKSPFYFFSFLFSLLRSFRKNEIIEDSIFVDFKIECITLVYLVYKLWKKTSEKLYLMLPVKRSIPIIKEGMNIAFICFGNICRSPFAEAYAKKHYGTHFNFISYGLNKQDNRLVPLNALTAARFYDVSLDEHKSQYVPQNKIEEMDIIFVMDKKNYLQLKQNFPEIKNKVFFLAGTKNIDDPFSKDITTFIDTYKEIKEQIDSLFLKKMP